jgi:hypothetical protein
MKSPVISNKRCLFGDVQLSGGGGGGYIATFKRPPDNPDI